MLLARVIAVRLTDKEGEALDTLVAHHNGKLRRVGLTPAITAASYARSCIIQAAVRAGLLPPLGGEGELDEPEVPLVVLAPLRRSEPGGDPLPPPTRFDRALDAVVVGGRDGDGKVLARKAGEERARSSGQRTRSAEPDDRFKKVLKDTVVGGRKAPKKSAGKLQKKKTHR